MQVFKLSVFSGITKWEQIRLIKSIRKIPDFPIPGILFYDVTTLFKDPWCLQELSDVMYEMYKDKGITKVVGIEE